MSTKPSLRTVTVSNPQGMHARPVDLFVKTALQFESNIQLVKDGERVDRKSILAILALGAQQGTQLAIEAIGSDADVALDALVTLVEQGFDEEDVDQQQIVDNSKFSWDKLLLEVRALFSWTRFAV